MKTKTRISPNRVYWPNCSVCKFMKKNKDFRTRVMLSTYFNPDGHESAPDVLHAYGDPFRIATFYQHLKRHQSKELQESIAKYRGFPAEDIKAALEGEVTSGQAHEQGLDEFIIEGRAKLKAKSLNITAQSYLQAIKIKADIEKSTKDRRLEAVKTMFKGITSDS